MFQNLFLFLAIFVLEIVLEIDNVTALKKSAEGLPDTPLCRGQMPHALALSVRIGLVYVFLQLMALFTQFQSIGTDKHFGQFGGILILFVSAGLMVNYFHGDKTVNRNISRRITLKKTSLGAFLLADAFLSLDTVIAAVALTTNWNLAMAAMISAAVCIMLFEKSLHTWLKHNPRMALIAYCVIGLLGINLILDAHGIHIPKYALLVVVVLGLWFDDMDKKLQKAKADDRVRLQGKKINQPSQLRGNFSHLVETINPGAAVNTVAGTASSTRPKTVSASWQDVVRKSEDTRDALAAEQLRGGGTLDLAPEVKQITISPTVDILQPLLPARAGLEEAYVYGTTHRAGFQLGQYGFVFMGQNADPVCACCGQQQAKTSSICVMCGHYRFHLPAGIFEVGSLRLVTKRA